MWVMGADTLSSGSAPACRSIMSHDPILGPLNDAQRVAVTADPKPVLVLAGAGSGKTRVLVHRVAWLIHERNVSPMSVLAVTFTNKAAGEMRGRIEQLLGIPTTALWVGTFHGLAHRLLRRGPWPSRPRYARRRSAAGDLRSQYTG